MLLPMGVVARNNIKTVGAEGAPILLLAHGFGCDQNLWRPVVERLQSEFRIVLMDHVGAGASDPAAWDAEKYSTLSGYTADVLEIVHELDLDDVVFVGHSVAAMIGALATIADPSRFAKLIMLTPSPRYIDDGDYHGGFSEGDIDELLESIDANYLGWSKAMAPVIMGNPDRPDLHAELEETFCRTDPACARVFARATFGIFGANIPALLRGLVAVFWYGIQTYLASLAVIVLIVRIWPGMESWTTGGFLGQSPLGWITFMVLWAVQLLVLSYGMESSARLRISRDRWCGSA